MNLQEKDAAFEEIRDPCLEAHGLYVLSQCNLWQPKATPENQRQNGQALYKSG